MSTRPTAGPGRAPPPGWGRGTTTQCPRARDTTARRAAGRPRPRRPPPRLRRVPPRPRAGGRGVDWGGVDWDDGDSERGFVQRGRGSGRGLRQDDWSVFFFNDAARSEIYVHDLHDRLPGDPEGDQARDQRQRRDRDGVEL